jgi:hypothetical protein
MMARATVAIVALLCVSFSGCASRDGPQTREGSQPYEWDEEAPERSELARTPYYVLKQSSSFLVKGASYARYILRVDQVVDDVEIFYTSTNKQAPEARKPNVRDAEYHYEFMQLRALGKSVRIMDVSASTAFSHANTGKTYTLAYIYGCKAGNCANYQYLVPYEGNPGDLRLDPGYYELVIATDEKLVVGVNLRIGSPLWTTHYHPQELGESRAEALETYVQAWAGSTPKDGVHREFVELVSAKEGEVLNYFAFANLIHRSNIFSVGSNGEVRVQVDDKEVPHRFEASGVNPTQPKVREAYAYGVSFNEPGPALHQLKVRLDFADTASFDNDLAAQLLVFGVATRASETVPGIPAPE